MTISHLSRARTGFAMTSAATNSPAAAAGMSRSETDVHRQRHEFVLSFMRLGQVVIGQGGNGDGRGGVCLGGVVGT